MGVLKQYPLVLQCGTGYCSGALGGGYLTSIIPWGPNQPALGLPHNFSLSTKLFNKRIGFELELMFNIFSPGSHYHYFFNNLKKFFHNFHHIHCSFLPSPTGGMCLGFMGGQMEFSRGEYKGDRTAGMTFIKILSSETKMCEILWRGNSKMLAGFDYHCFEHWQPEQR